MNTRGGIAFAAMDHLWWRFWWADGYARQPGLYVWLGRYPGVGQMVRLWGMDFVLQLAIVALTLPGVWLAGGNGGAMKWGFALLLASQPFWLAATWRARQYGAFAIALVFAAMWLRAVINSF